jgi:hypothetical protein
VKKKKEQFWLLVVGRWSLVVVVVVVVIRLWFFHLLTKNSPRIERAPLLLLPTNRIPPHIHHN